jgi:hypothetical protein
MKSSEPIRAASKSGVSDRTQAVIRALQLGDLGTKGAATMKIGKAAQRLRQLKYELNRLEW